uniref:Uncharacterized protein n=1 Tax=Strombidium rassoulzadegani TaxID=1082188 RepID=A0A7S3CN90_9SPIT|mmetsp:Transcript_17913/g.30466  ORF Transcript_17913/g.30466 Transcript_17913/m.30466 type:complete len:138 (+) Transcript_17913:596-1009(+)
MDEYLPSGETYIQRALFFSLSSPFNYSGSLGEQEIEKLYLEATDFALNLILKGTTDGSAPKDDKCNFAKVLEKNQIDDEQEKLIMLDYIMIDFVKNRASLSSCEFKSAVSAYDLQNKKSLQDQFSRISSLILASGKK